MERLDRFVDIEAGMENGMEDIPVVDADEVIAGYSEEEENG